MLSKSHSHSPSLPSSVVAGGGVIVGVAGGAVVGAVVAGVVVVVDCDRVGPLLLLLPPLLFTTPKTLNRGDFISTAKNLPISQRQRVSSERCLPWRSYC